MGALWNCFQGWLRCEKFNILLSICHPWLRGVSPGQLHAVVVVVVVVVVHLSPERQRRLCLQDAFIVPIIPAKIGAVTGLETKPKLCINKKIKEEKKCNVYIKNERREEM